MKKFYKPNLFKSSWKVKPKRNFKNLKLIHFYQKNNRQNYLITNIAHQK